MVSRTRGQRTNPYCPCTHEQQRRNQVMHDGCKGVSIYYLKEIFLQDLIREGFDSDSTIYELEQLYKQPGSNFLSRGCLRRTKWGSTNMDRLKEVMHIGHASLYLSYCWDYSIGDVISFLLSHCASQDLNPESTYVWIDFFCLDRPPPVHDTDVLPENFHKKIKHRIKTIGNVLVMVSPWKNPIYFTRTWCLFELYIAHLNQCKICLSMTCESKKGVIEAADDIDDLIRAVDNVKIETSSASQKEDYNLILESLDIINEPERVNEDIQCVLQEWLTSILIESISYLESSRSDNLNEDLKYSFLCNKVGSRKQRNQEFEEALELYKKALKVFEKVFQNEHSSIAESHHKIGDLLHENGDLNGALKSYRKERNIYLELFGHSNTDIADCCISITRVLQEMGDLDEAIAECRSAKAIYEILHGNDHPSQAMCCNLVGAMLCKKGDLKQALKEFRIAESVYKRHRRVHDDFNASTVCWDDIGVYFPKESSMEGTYNLYRKAQIVYEEVHGEVHPDTATFYNNIDTLISKQYSMDGALIEYLKVKAVYEKVCTRKPQY